MDGGLPPEVLRQMQSIASTVVGDISKGTGATPRVTWYMNTYDLTDLQSITMMLNKVKAVSSSMIPHGEQVTVIYSVAG